ncbi:hypothetical protein K435DRAFT_839618 [Dendrothele bispora CBS 962.96]|uniref:Ubiquitin 3 binding protein But2 C-terminal domain-containing protein n=1 Tax=Dendrothele bispora (strain CBS 962.96) TaxID=1314807 RepID=A0A4S8LZZ5_DENBC|nr:hypothetical protein K435DRAFT_839618 [Dendrothele bispora CBS 962.96]
MFSQHRQYESVPQAIEHIEQNPGILDQRIPHRWMTCILLLTLLNLSFITYHVFFGVNFGTQNTDISNLDYRSTYIGFDLLYNKTAAPYWKQIVNKPRYIRVVSPTKPDQVIRDNIQYDLTPDGYVSSLLEQIFVDKELSTIVQFRTIDWGMERCKLVFTVPKNFSSGIMSNSQIDVWALDSESPSYFVNPTWRKRPKRVNLVTTFTLSPGESSVSSNFPCPSASNYNFELACSATSLPAPCYVNLVQSRSHEIMFYLEQSQSI